jgi:nicotinamidase-related amidase
MSNSIPSALLVIDVQEGFKDAVWGRRNNPDLEKNIATLLARWRKRSWPIFHVQHLSRAPYSPLYRTKSGVNFMECAKPLPDEIIIQKEVNSCFIGTDLESTLRNNTQKSLIFTGLTSDHCVSTSTRMAANFGFKCCIVSDATATFDRIDQNGVTYPADLVHAVSLASLHGEFCTVVNTKTFVLDC